MGDLSDNYSGRRGSFFNFYLSFAEVLVVEGDALSEGGILWDESPSLFFPLEGSPEALQGSRASKSQLMLSFRISPRPHSSQISLPGFFKRRLSSFRPPDPFPGTPLARPIAFLSKRAFAH